MKRFLLFIFAVSGYADELSDRAFAILKRECLACHGAGLKMSNLDLRTRQAAVAGGERGEAFVPYHPERSRLYVFTAHEQNPSMPPGKKLPAADLEVLKRWILAGSVYPEDAAESAGKISTAALEERPITAEERNFWAFRKLTPPPAPGTGHPVDACLRAEWTKRGLTPSPRADRRTLIRRAYLDVLGLPPAPEEADAFAADTSPDAWPKLVDKLLASPHYGERWARHWLDLVRYADSGGFEYDRDRDNAWRFRDWAVRALNADLPYDRFVKLQIAGDEIAPGDADAMIATGFLRLGPENNVKNEMTRMDELDDIVSTTSLTFLGMTAGCARCHNHKFDPIPQKDYYRMQAVFFSTKPLEHPLVDASVVVRHKEENDRITALQAPLKKRKADLEKPVRDQIYAERIARLAPYMQLAWNTPAEKRTEGQRLNARQIEKSLKAEDAELTARMSAAQRSEFTGLQQQIDALEKQRPKPFDAAMAIGEQGRDPLPSYFLFRGSPSNKGSLMKPGVLTVASWDAFDAPPPPEQATTTFRRKAFAEWISSPHNPLTARVMVNRIWQHHFGSGLVATPSNFGKTGEAPTHPHLLDWLASEFVARGWSMKSMHRLMLTSDAYQMASDDITANLKLDPQNRMLWRMPRARLEAEIVRDNMLAAAGTLNRTVGGPAVLPYIDPVLFQGSSKRTWEGKPDDDASTWRRSLYVFNKRSIRYPMFESFDQPDMITSCARRNSSTTAPQALLLMNNASVRIHAAHFAERLRRDAGKDPEAQIRRAYELALSRPPRDSEMREGVAFLRTDDKALTDFCHTLFNLNEFVYIP